MHPGVHPGLPHGYPSHPSMAGKHPMANTNYNPQSGGHPYGAHPSHPGMVRPQGFHPGHPSQDPRMHDPRMQEHMRQLMMQRA